MREFQAENLTVFTKRLEEKTVKTVKIRTH